MLNNPCVYVNPRMRTTSLCVRGSHKCKKFVFGVFEQYLVAYGDSHMGICTHFAHEKFAYVDPHVQKCPKKHISDRLFLHNEVVRIWGLTFILLFALSVCMHFQIAVVIPHYFYFFKHLAEIHSIHYRWLHITAEFILLFSNSFYLNASLNTTRKHWSNQNT